MSETPFSTHVSNVRAAVLAWDAFPEFQTPGRLARTKSAVDMLAARLLAAGSALPGEKAAVIQWVVRFRTEKATVSPQPSAESVAKARQKVARQEAKRAKGKPHPKAKGAVRSTKAARADRPERRRPHDPKVNGLSVQKPSSRSRTTGAGKRAEFLDLETRYKAIALSAKPDSELAERQWRSQASRLLADLHEYQHQARGLVPGVFYEKVLEDFRRWRTGLTAISLGAVPGSVSYAPVPSEISLRGGGWVVSGGLPTLGRRR